MLAPPPPVRQTVTGRCVLGALAVSLCLGPAACAKTRKGAKTTYVKDAKGRRIELPAPLPLPDDPPFLVIVDDPAAWIARVDAWTRESTTPESALQRELVTIAPASLATAIAQAARADEPWALTRFADEEIWHIPLRKDGVAAVQDALSGLASEGEFGARRLPPRGGDDPMATRGIPRIVGEARPTLAWLDERVGGVTLARTLPGLVTGAELVDHYSAEPMRVRVEGAQVGRPKILSVTARGSIQEVEAEIAVSDDAADWLDPRADLQLAGGSLPMGLHNPAFAAAVTGRWTQAPSTIKQQIARAKKMADNAPFLVGGLLRDMSEKFAKAARTWDGRYLLAVGEGPRAYVGVGCEAPEASGQAVMRLADTVAANASLLGGFVGNVPTISIKKNVSKGSPVPIHRITVGKVKKYLPKPAQALLDDSSRLDIALAFSPRVGAGLLVVGPAPVEPLRAWLDAVEDAPESRGEAPIVAGSLAVSPATVFALTEDFSAEALAKLQVNAPRVDFRVERWDARGARVVLSWPQTRSRGGRTGARAP